MPLLDHFHPPLSEERHWEGFHSKWANVLVDELNQTLLPPGYFAEPHVHVGARVEIDAATFEGVRRPAAPLGRSDRRLAGAHLGAAAPTLVMPAAFPDTFEVRIFGTETGPRLVAAIELVSPANKDRAGTSPRLRDQVRAATCAKGSVLSSWTSSPAAAAICTMRSSACCPNAGAFLFPLEPPLYATAYRPIRRDEADQTEVWLAPLAFGRPLPVLPLALTAELCLPINLESTYADACRKLRLS